MSRCTHCGTSPCCRAGPSPGETYRLSLVAILTMVVLAVVVFARRKHIEPTPS